MRLSGRLLLVPAAAVLLVAGVSMTSAQPATAGTARVLMVDNDAPTPNQGIDHRTGEWGFSPHHIAVMKGEPIVFDNPTGNFRPHNVVSVSRVQSAPPPGVEIGTAFNSGIAQETLVRPGGSTTLDTSGLAPGHYGFICTLHPWMTGSVTVLAGPEPAAPPSQ